MQVTESRKETQPCVKMKRGAQEMLCSFSTRL